jgi:hypothetical protein
MTGSERQRPILTRLHAAEANDVTRILSGSRRIIGQFNRVSPITAFHFCGAVPVDWPTCFAIIRLIITPSGYDLGRARDAGIPLSVIKRLSTG